jgi:hypothetical protein
MFYEKRMRFIFFLGRVFVSWVRRRCCYSQHTHTIVRRIRSQFSFPFLLSVLKSTKESLTKEVK